MSYGVACKKIYLRGGGECHYPGPIVIYDKLVLDPSYEKTEIEHHWGEVGIDGLR